MPFTIVIERSPANHAAYAPDLPGCVATGTAREETLDEMRNAIESHVESLHEHGDPVPKRPLLSDGRRFRYPGWVTAFAHS